MKIGIDVSNLIHTNFLAGPQRVLLSICTELIEISKQTNVEVYGVNCSLRSPSSRILEIQNNAILNRLTHSINELDVLIVADSNNHHIFEELQRTRSRCKVVSVLHDVLPLTNTNWYIFGNRPNYLREFRFYLMRIFHYSHKIILPSKKTVTDLETINLDLKNRELVVIPYGTSFTQIQSRSKREIAHNLICVNTIEPKKGHDDILDAWEILNSNDLKYSLILVGREGWNSANIVNRIIMHKDFDIKLFWYKELNDAQVMELYKEASVAINASRDEGFGLPIEEALSQGLKVVCRDTPVFRERTYENQYFFSGGAKELADKILLAESMEIKRFPYVRTMKDFSIDLLKIIRNT
jgi:glycosyltransferase involved in cell wall biosynthesis